MTLAWPGGKVGRQESQCESSQAFSLRLAGFITATNHWPDKSSYFILPSFTSALLFLFSSLFYFPKNLPPPLFSRLCGGVACFTLHPAWFAFPSQCNSPIFYFLRFFSSLSFHLLNRSAHTYTVLLPSSTPPLSPSPSPPLSIV